MSFIKPSYEQYCSASRYAHIRYRFGVYIQLVSAILLLFLLVYTMLNVETMKSNPVDYAEEKMGVTCYYSLDSFLNNVYDGSIRNITIIEKG